MGEEGWAEILHLGVKRAATCMLPAARAAPELFAVKLGGGGLGGLGHGTPGPDGGKMTHYPGIA